MDIVNTPADLGYANGANVASAVNRDLQQVNSRTVADVANANKERSSENQESNQDSLDLSKVNANTVDTMAREEQSQAIEVAVKEVESFLQVQNRNLSFSIDDNTDRSVVTVKDSSSGDVIRQIPSEEVLQLAERIKSLQEDIGSSVGVFINNKV